MQRQLQEQELVVVAADDHYQTSLHQQDPVRADRRQAGQMLPCPEEVLPQMSFQTISESRNRCSLQESAHILLVGTQDSDKRVVRGHAQDKQHTLAGGDKPSPQRAREQMTAGGLEPADPVQMHELTDAVHIEQVPAELKGKRALEPIRRRKRQDSPSRGSRDCAYYRMRMRHLRKMGAATA